MNHLGILAHSIEGASLCLRTFAQHGSAAIGRHQHPDVTLDCIAMGHSMPAWDRGDHRSIRDVLATSVQRLAVAGATFFVCPDNTAHIALGVDGPPLALPGLHIADVVAARAARDGRDGRDGRRTVGVLGTRYTMDSDLYPAALATVGIDAMVPDPADREAVNSIIFDELVEGVFTDAARARYVRVIEDLRERGCDAVALVCTEIPLLISEDDSPLPTLDSTRLLAAAAFDVSTGAAPLPTWRGGPPA